MGSCTQGGGVGRLESVEDGGTMPVDVTRAWVELAFAEAVSVVDGKLECGSTSGR